VETGQWQFPGGHLEVGEDYLACAERETLEETGLVVRAEKLVAVTNDVFSESKHYVTLFVSCRRVDETMEPKVCGLLPGGTSTSSRLGDKLTRLDTGHGAGKVRVVVLEDLV
jgi:ADP-ribose pyrophosphatase YjhB (NUDIX family)